MAGHPLYDVTDSQYQIVYDFLSFTFACMAASTIFFWLRLPSIHEKYKSALVITGLVTFIAAYHYLRIFNSWVDAYKYDDKINQSNPEVGKIMLTGTPFNDAYRYMDWLLTVPLLLIEIILVMDLSEEETSEKSWKLGSAAALMIILGYPGELILEESELHTRWIYWALAMIPFIYIVYTLVVGLANATNAEPDTSIRKSIRTAQYMTVVSWLTYPIVYVIPMLGAKGSNAVVGIQMGYCISDIIAKCGVGFIIYGITNAKSQATRKGLLQNNNI
jgi:bacteriorhodopsin